MSRDWKPGDVALVGNAPAMYVDNSGDEYFISPIGTHWRSCSPERQLVVLDPEDREQMVALAEAWDNVRDVELGKEPMPLRAYRMQAALRSLITPPRPPEPLGLGAVVEDEEGDFWVYAGTRALKDGETREWVHGGRARWYADITAVRVLSEGVVQS